MLRQVFISFILFIICVTTKAQQYPLYNPVYGYDFAFNPAIAGSNYYPSAAIVLRKNWLQVENAPSTISAMLSFRLGRFDFYTPQKMLNKSQFLHKERVGIGLLGYKDSNGPVSNTGYKLVYSYHIPVGFQQFSFGLSADLRQLEVDESGFTSTDPDDPLLQGGKRSYIMGNASAGVYFYSENFFAGFSVNDLFRNKAIIEDNFTTSTLDMLFMSGFRIRLDRFWSLEPSLLSGTVDGDDMIYQLSGKLIFIDEHWLNITYHSYSSITTSFGIRVSKLFHVGYGYEYFFGTGGTRYQSRHMFYLGRNIGTRNVGAIKRQRYRYIRTTPL
jgi:type IX secretion system PorP/SprF family membrane protein